mgnify:FL=1
MGFQFYRRTEEEKVDLTTETDVKKMPCRDKITLHMRTTYSEKKNI